MYGGDTFDVVVVGVSPLVSPPSQPHPSPRYAPPLWPPWNITFSHHAGIRNAMYALNVCMDECMHRSVCMYAVRDATVTLELVA